MVNWCGAMVDGSVVEQKTQKKNSTSFFPLNSNYCVGVFKISTRLKASDENGKGKGVHNK